MRTYYKITCTREFGAAGAGLGYEELFGHVHRYHWDRSTAQAALEHCIMTCPTGEEATYAIELRTFYDDGHFDDEGDENAVEQLEPLDCPPSSC